MGSDREAPRAGDQPLLGVSHHCAGTPLRDCVREALDQYFARLDGHDTSGLFDLVMGEVEAPLLEVVMRRSGGNLTRAASLLGINRATLRKKLRHYGIG